MIPRLAIIYVARRAWITDAETPKRGSGPDKHDLDAIAVHAAVGTFVTLGLVVLGVWLLTL